MVTGCSSGFGRCLSEALLQRGYKVALTARRIATVHDLVARYPGQALAVALDVTSKSSIDHAVRVVRESLGEIDVLVNNAGYAYFAAVEEGDEKAVRAMFETNFHGLVATTLALLPAMRERRSGVIVNLSSSAGLVAYPASGYYAATKFAVEAISEALSKEVAPLGIRVLLVEPGPFRTKFMDNAKGAEKVAHEEYEETVGARFAALRSSNGRQKGDPVRAAEAIIAAVLSPNPPLRLVLGARALGGIRAKIEAMTSEIAAWESTTLGSDFPE
jgi:NADP-dependent 3-hydroxy acid dehydrogenase YdfG